MYRFFIVPVLLWGASCSSRLLAKGAEQAVMRLPVVRPTESLRVKDGDTLTLTAAPAREKINGKWMRRLAYNGMIPGPTLVADQKAKIKLILINKTEVPTTLHSHGLRVDDRNDGVVGIGQDAVSPGGSFTYTLSFPDSGLFWYHPHVKEEFTQEMGLYGQYLVTFPEESKSIPGVKSEVIVLDDILIKDGKMPFFSGDDVSFALMGRYGNELLINNRRRWQKKYQQSEIVRFYFVNASNARPFRIGFSNAKLKVLGSDNGFYEKEYYADEIVLGPSERAFAEVLFENAGTAKLWHRSSSQKVNLGVFQIGRTKVKRASTSISLKEHPEVTEDMRAVRKLADAPPQFTMIIDAKLTGDHAEHMAMSTPASGGIEWEDEMGGMSVEMTQKNVQWLLTDPATGKTNMDIQWHFREGEPVKVRIANTGKTHPMQHPIHFHGQRFVVISKNGKPESNLAWKDTVLVPAGQTFEVILDNLNPGRWMGHCHIAEHLAIGMMFGFDVLAKGSTNVPN